MRVPAVRLTASAAKAAPRARWYASVWAFWCSVVASVVLAATSPAPSSAPSYAPVTSGRSLEFPRDYGSHPEFRTEWWYVTGWLKTRQGESLGFQITFFRSKPAIDEKNPSAFTAHQLLIAHCAISDPKRGSLWQDQRIRRAELGLADAAREDTDVHIDRWSLKRVGDSYRAKIDADGFSFDLDLATTQPVLLNGEAGLSRKGPASRAASYYYSLPHLRVNGAITRGGGVDPVSGEAWFDHEWSSEYLQGDAVGWDWIGINLDGGAALMAFRIRAADGSALWAGGTLRGADGNATVLQPPEVEFHAGRRWISPRTAIAYPVEWQVRIGSRNLALVPLLDDQENDTRLSTGAIYWEGAVRVDERGKSAGQGYLELTGYGERLRLR